MKKRAVFKYYRDIDNDNSDEESPYDFTAVDLRGENHSNDEYDDFGQFSFDDDSHGVLPFDDDLELVEEDFALPDIEEEDDSVDDKTKSEGSSEIDDESFVLDRPEDAPDFTEDFLDDEDEEEPAPKTKLFPKRKKAEEDPSPTIPSHIATAAEGVSVGDADASAPRRPLPKVRNSALQPLLVINRSKHSFDPNKKRASVQSADESDKNDFENFDDGDFVDFSDGDIEDMSHDMNTENVFHEADDNDDAAVEETVNEVAVEQSDTSAESDGKSDAVVAEEFIDTETIADTEEIIDGTTDEAETSEEVPAGRIFFDDFEDSESIFEDDGGPIFGPHTVQAVDVTKSAAEALESSKAYTDKANTEELNNSGEAEPEDDVAAEPAGPEESSEIPAKKPVEVRIKELKMARKKKKRQKKVKTFVKEIFGWVGLVFAAFFIAIVINLYVARPSVVSGRSMMPTLQNGDTIIISKVPYMLGEVGYGDIVVIDRQVNRERTFTVEVIESLKYNVLTQSLFDENELNEDTFWVKRIIGLPGDVIEFYEGKVYRNGELLNEGYIFTQDVTSYPDGEQFIVQEGCVFVMGDNRNESLDSRSLALHDEQIAMDHIVGKLISK